MSVRSTRDGHGTQHGGSSVALSSKCSCGTTPCCYCWYQLILILLALRRAPRWQYGVDRRSDQNWISWWSRMPITINLSAVLLHYSTRQLVAHQVRLPPAAHHLSNPNPLHQIFRCAFAFFALDEISTKHLPLPCIFRSKTRASFRGHGVFFVLQRVRDKFKFHV